ncbi:GH92 family glycosyl hydrolase [Microbacterium sp.]|uniref:GH92 family glycosyl hydrolase n=1 Tax=Microbacterium sp. TaxID=51671 RepID=UPI003565D843
MDQSATTGTVERAADRASPDTVLTAPAGTGFVSRVPWRVHSARGEGPVRRRLLDVATGHIVGRDDELSWMVLPAGTEDTETRWESTGVALDLRFEDGTWLSATGASDQYGCALDADAQKSSQRLWPEQWNLRRVSLAAHAGKRIDRVVVEILGSVLVDATAFIDGVEITPRRRTDGDPLADVVTTRGTHSTDAFSRGNTAPLVSLPHGGVFGLPMTDASAADWPYQYAPSVDAMVSADGARLPALQAFATSHISSPWMQDHGVFQLMPSSSTTPVIDREARSLSFRRPDEEAGPHRYRVRFLGGLEAELTAGDFAVGLRVHYPERAGSIIFDHLETITSVTEARDGEVWTMDAALAPHGDKPGSFIHVRVTGVIEAAVRFDAGRLTGHVAVRAEDAPVDAVVGQSSIDAAHARENALRSGGFDAMQMEAERQWRTALALIEIDGAAAHQLVSLRSGIYRAMLYPTRYDEPQSDGSALSRSPYSGGQLLEGPVSASNGFWDTYRTAWPLLALLDPAETARHAAGFVAHAAASGWTPRWSAPAAEDCMTGTTFDLVFADLAAKSLADLDLEAGYAAARKNATVPAADQRVGRKGLIPALFRGWVSTEVEEGLAWTLDNAMNDAGIALLAGEVARQRVAAGVKEDPDLDAEIEYFARRALEHEKVFDRERGFFIGRRADGGWRDDFDPSEWGHDYTETTAWGTAFTATHDGAGLAQLHGGEEALGHALDQMMLIPETASADLRGHYPRVIHEMREARDVRMGMLALSNQPAHHIPFMYMFAGRHDDAHALIGDALDRLFVGSDFGQGYPGDEDNGEMSAWYIFATIGLYPLVPASGTYVLVPPSVRCTRIRPRGGQPIELVVCGGDTADRYIEAVRVDGEPWNSISIDHARLSAGCTIEFDLSPTPTRWAAESRPVSLPDVLGHRGQLDDVCAIEGIAGSVGEPELLVDDLGAAAVSFREGDHVILPFTSASHVSLLTVTTDVAGTFTFSAEITDGDGRLLATRVISDALFEWDLQTRVFRMPETQHPGAAVRIVAESPLQVRQFQILASSAPRVADESR